MTPDIAHRISVDFSVTSLFDAVNFAIAATVLAVGLWKFYENPWRLARPAFALSGLLNVFFQWPLFLTGDTVASSLSNYIWFAFIIHSSAAALLSWVVLTPRLDIKRAQEKLSALATKQIAILVLAGAASLYVFFDNMPPRCTAIYALIFNPDLTLLAREFTIKLANSTLATSLFGGVANAISPFIVATGTLFVFAGIQKRSFVTVIVWLPIIAICILSVMISGSKGLLLPTFIAVVVVALFWFRRPALKITAAALGLVLIFGSLTGFELLRERGGQAAPYDLGGCSVQVGACKPAQSMLMSATARGGYGLNAQEIQRMLEEVEQQCAGHSIDHGDLTQLNRDRVIGVDRAQTYLSSILYRAFVTPIQIAAWHFAYVEAEGSPGKAAAPFALKLFGHSVDMAKLVYQKYGVIFSSGDATITSTAPTTFFITYPAYYGVLGLIGALVLVIGLDLAYVVLARNRFDGSLALLPAAVAVTGYNMMSSDFFVVLLSHGGAVAILLLYLLGLTTARQAASTAKPPKTGDPGVV